MWKFLYKLASPKWFYQQSESWIRHSKIPVFLILMMGMFWGLFWAPQDYQQGDAFRIIYVHVPAAFMSMALYGLLGFLSVLVLVWRIKMAGVMLSVVPALGASMAFLALITGSIWGKPMWGTWWIWDARLTSELILLFLYIAIIAVRNTVGQHERADRLIAVLCLTGLVDLPVIHYSVYWWNSLHQGATLTILSKPKIAPAMLYPLLLTLLGFSLYCALVAVMRARYLILERERKQQWVKNIFASEIK